jgi:cell division protein FtsW
MVPGVGARANGATRWFEVGPIRFQPSEIAKFAVALYLAAVLSSQKFRVRKVLPGIIVPMIPVGIIGALVLAQPDMGTASVIMINAFIMLLVAGALKRHLVTLAGVGVGLAGLLVVVAPYRLARLLTFLNPMEDYYGRGYQVVHSLVALASGGLLGEGLCEGREKFYLPAAQTDFIFPATVGEEAGLLGSLAVVALFVIFTYRGLSIANRAKSPYYTLLAAGLTSMVSVQAAINILVVTSSMPATGVPLPFMSYGGTALIFALTTAGLLLNISRKAHVTPEDLGGKDEDYLDRRRDGRTYISRPQYSRRSTVRKPRSRATVRR